MPAIDQTSLAPTPTGASASPASNASAILALAGQDSARIAEQLSQLARTDPAAAGTARAQIEAQLTPVQRGQLAADLPVHATLPNGKGVDFGPNGIEPDAWINTVRSTPQFHDTYAGLVKVAGGSESNADLKAALIRLHDSGLTADQYLTAQGKPAAATTPQSVPAPRKDDGGGWKGFVSKALDTVNPVGYVEDWAQPKLAAAGHSIGLDSVPGVGKWTQQVLDTPGSLRTLRQSVTEGVLGGAEDLVGFAGKTVQYGVDNTPGLGEAGDLVRGQTGQLPGALDAVLPSAQRGEQTGKAIVDTGKVAVSYYAAHNGNTTEMALDMGARVASKVSGDFTAAGQQGGVDAQMRYLGHGAGEAAFDIGTLFIGGEGAAAKLGDLGKLGQALNDTEKVTRGAETLEEAGSIGSKAVKGTEAAEALSAADKAKIVAAQADQAAGGYLPDAWGMSDLKAGDEVIGGLPGQSPYYTDARTLEASGGSRSDLFQRLQVTPHPEFGYRPKVGVYEVVSDSRVPSGQALANTTKGVGGGNQFFIQDFKDNLRLVREIELGK